MILVAVLAGASLIVGCGAGYLWYKRTNSLSPHLPEAGGVAPFETLPSGQMLYSFNYENRVNDVVHGQAGFADQFADLFIFSQSGW